MKDYKRTAVVIEDDPEVKEVLGGLLTRMGFEVHYALDGPFGLQLVNHHRPELVCLDLTLPSLSGHEVCQSIRSDTANESTRILITTARSSPQDRALAETLGADGYLDKPFSTSAFLRAVDRVMRSAKGTAALQPGVQI